LKTFREKLIDRRAELGLTQNELSKRSGIGKRTITSYETDGRIPQPSQLYKLSKALGVSPEYLKNDNIDDKNYGIERMEYVEETRKLYGQKEAVNVEKLLKQNTALFAGGELSEEAKDSFFQAVMKAYIDCKEAAKETYGKKQ
jgi:transcriptional regulator with XRE-family HTH domain